MKFVVMRIFCLMLVFFYFLIRFYKFRIEQLLHLELLVGIGKESKEVNIIFKIRFLN